MNFAMVTRGMVLVALESSSPGMPMQSHRDYVLLTFRYL